jgi:23S rRNA (uracil1939-C5)-methyltransferase
MSGAKEREVSPARFIVTSLAPGGDGVAHVLHEDRRRTVFVARAAPGDVIEAEVDFARSPARASSMRLVEPSAVRVEPPCTLAELCGGCDWMHLAVAAQIDAHTELVRAALERAAGPLPAIVTHPAKETERYRTRARLALEAGRGRVAVGYRRAASHAIADVRSCLVLDERLEVVLGTLSELFAAERGRGEVALALGLGGRPVADLSWIGTLGGQVLAGIERLVAKGMWGGASIRLDGATRPARIGDPRAITGGGDGEPLLVPSGGFAQANAVMNQKLVERAVRLLEPDGADVLELFAGSGNFSVLVGRRARSLTVVESDPEAVALARVNLKERGLPARIVEADADGFDPAPPIRAALLDPPRRGAAGAVLRLARSRVRRVVYVSCNPATLARDVATLGEHGFSPTALETFEMFPHTSHVEVVALLERSARRS